MDRLLAIGEAAKVLGVSITTLRRWEKEGKLLPEPTSSKHRRYDLAKLKPETFHQEDLCQTRLDV
jgi:putative resolvase